MHQGSALSPLLFVMVMEALSWEMLYADDLVVIAINRTAIIGTGNFTDMIANPNPETWP